MVGGALGGVDDHHFATRTGVGLGFVVNFFKSHSWRVRRSRGTVFTFHCHDFSLIQSRSQIARSGVLLNIGIPFLPILRAVLPLVLTTLLFAQRCIMLLLARLCIALTPATIVAVIAIALFLLSHVFDFVFGVQNLNYICLI